MPDETPLPDSDASAPPRPPGAAPGAPLNDPHAEGLFGAAHSGHPQAPPSRGPEEAPTLDGAHTASMTGAGLWQPPAVEEVARLFPHYEILALLGRGGMGAVYKARQVELDRLVAIKLLPLEISADHGFADRFRREARAMAKLNHPNIITVHDFGATSAGHLYFAMEFVEGANLHQIIHGPGLAPARALGIIIGVCEALAYAHGKGVVHRDIKPANVIVSTDGQVKVADFGLARLTDPAAMELGHTLTGTVMGTPDYMAPEQMRGMNVDHRADIYSLGVMLYEMLCKDVPRGFYEPPSVRIGVDTRVDEVVKKAMQQQPERRYQQTGEMKADVAQIHTSMLAPSLGVAAAVAGVGAPAPSKSNRAARIAIAAAVFVAGAAVFVTMKPAKRVASALRADGSAQRADATPRAASALADSGWQPLFTDAEWKATVPDKHEYKDGLLHVVRAFSKKQPSADGAIRARIRRLEQSKNETLKVRDGGQDANGYRLLLSAAGDSVTLTASVTAKTPVRLRDAMLPKPVPVGGSVLLELRAQGDRITALADGAVLIDVTDGSLADAGEWGVTASSGWFESVEVQPLATGAASAQAASPAASEVRAFAGHRYQFVAAPLQWPEAKAKAAAMGGHLATVTSREEKTWIESVFIPQLPPHRMAWIGGQRDGAAQPWQWITGEPFPADLLPAVWNEGEKARRYVGLHKMGDGAAWNFWEASGKGTQNAARCAGFIVEWDDLGGSAPPPAKP